MTLHEGEIPPERRGRAAYVAEFLGTLALVMFITLSVSLYVDPEAGANASSYGDYAVVGLVHVLVLFILVQSLAIACGAHFNPAVTAALAALGRIKPIDAAIYVAIQLAGGIAGALITMLLLGDLERAERAGYGAPALTDRIGGDVLLGMLAEGVGAFFLVFVIVGVAVHPAAAKDWAGLAFGAALGLAVMAFGPLTGGAFNPARALGPAVASGEFGDAGTWLLAFVVAPVAGGILAALAYVRIYVAPERRGRSRVGSVG